MTRPIIEIAKSYRNAGLSVIPIAHGNKRPTCNWKRYERELIDDTTLELRYAAQFNGHLPDRVGVIAGDISGGLEIIDFDAGGVDYDAWVAQVKEDAPSLLERLIIERTPTGGYHVAYRCANFEHSRKLCYRWFVDEEKAGWKATIETRGEGGYCVAAPSDGYECIQGDWHDVPSILDDDRNLLIDAACSLNEKPAKQPPGIVVRQSTGMINDDSRLHRAQCYLDAMPESVDGEGGHASLFNAVTAMMYGFDLSEAETRKLIVEEFNPRCQPPWTEKEIEHKIADAIQKPSTNPRGWLLQQSQPGDMIDISGLLATIEPRRTQEKRFNILSCPALMRADLTFNFLIDNVLVEGQPCIVGGPVKCMKTSLLLDMAVALASGTPFLGRFPVKEPCKVLVMSGESGLLTIRDTIRRVSDTATVDPVALDNLLICDRLPSFNDPESLLELVAVLRTHRPRVVMYDPAYWMINGEDAGNVMKMGRQLIGLAQLCQGHGATMVAPGLKLVAQSELGGYFSNDSASFIKSVLPLIISQ